MYYINQLICISTILFVFIVSTFNCYPIEVTGKNITYYKLTPNEGSGSYNFNYGTHDGSKRSERGFIKREPGSEKPLLVVTGSFKYPDANEVFYIADEQGYRIVSKEDIDDLHSKLPNEILPTAKPITRSSLGPILGSSTARSSLNPSASALVSVTPKSFVEPEGSSRPVQIPVTESQVIKLNVIQPVSSKTVTCPPGRCSGSRQSKIIKIKPLKFG